MSGKVNNVDLSSRRIKEIEAPGMWQDFYDDARPFFKVYGYKNDFFTWVSDEWTVTEVGTSLQRILDASNGQLSLITGGTEDDGNNCQLGGSADGETTGESFLPAAGRNIWFEIRIASPAWTQHEIFFGLHIQDTTVAEGKGTDYIGFVSNDGSALVNFVSTNTSISSTVTNVVTPADSATTFYKLGFKISGLDKAEAYLNDILVGTITTQIPATEMKLTIAHTTGEGSAKTLNVDYVACYQDGLR